VQGAVDLSAGVLAGVSLEQESLSSASGGGVQQTELRPTGPLRVGDTVQFSLAQGTAVVPVSCTFTSLDPASQMQQLAAAINEAVGVAQTGRPDLGIRAAAVSITPDGAADPLQAVRLSGAAGQGFTVADLRLERPRALAGSLLLQAGALKPELSQAGALSSGDTAGTSLEGRIVAVSAAVAASGGIAVGVGTVSNAVESRHTLQVDGSSGQGTGQSASPALRASDSLQLRSQGRQTIAQTQVIAVTGAGGAVFGVAGALNFASAEGLGSSRTLVNGGRLEADRIEVSAGASNALDSSAYGGAVAGGAAFGGGFGYFQAHSTLGRQGGEAEVEARLGDGVVGRARTISLSTSSADKVLADSVSASLGIGKVALAGAGAQSQANTYQTLRTAIGTGADLRASEAISLAAAVDQSNRDGSTGEVIDSRAKGIAVAAGFGGAGGGAATRNTIASDGRIEVGSNALLEAPSLSLSAGNRLSKNRWGQADYGAGERTDAGDANTYSLAFGMVSVAINPSRTTIGSRSAREDEAFGTTISVGDGAHLLATGNSRTPGRLALAATNDVYATDLSILDATTGLGVSVGTSELSNDSRARIQANNGSRLRNASGDVSLTVSGNGTVSSSSSGLSGIAGVAVSNAEANNRPTQAISLDGAQLEGDNLRLWSGLSEAGVPNLLRTAADAKSSVISVGVTVPTATANTTDTNSIDINGTTALLARANVDLRAQPLFGTRGPTARSSTDAQVRMVVAIPIPGIDNISDKTTNTITIADTATVTAGLQHDLRLWALPAGADLAAQNAYLNATLPAPLLPGQALSAAQKQALGLEASSDYTFQVLPAPAEAGAALADQVALLLPTALWQSTPPRLVVANLGSSLNRERRRLEALLVSYAGVPSQQALILAQRQQLLDQARRLGLLDEATGTINETLEVPALELPALRSAPGSIFLNAPGDGGSITVNGSKLSAAQAATAPAPTNLRASGDARIGVRNVLPLVLLGSDMRIDDSRVTDVVDGVYTVFDPGRIYLNRKAAFAAGSGTPSGASGIVIDQRPDRNLRFNGQPSPVPADLYLNGLISNENGAVTITNSDASVLISGEVRGKPVNINAAGNFSLNSDTWVHTGNDPVQLVGDRFLSEARNTGKATLSRQALQALLDPAAPAAIVSRGDISINALYLNINGLIQSGTPDLTMTVAADFNPTSSGSIVGDDGQGIAGIRFASSGGLSLPLAGYANAGDRSIRLDPIRVSGGRIRLAGQILSTGNGRVVAFDGQPNLTIDNRSGWTLALGEVNLSAGQGEITITDTPNIQLVPSAVDLPNSRFLFEAGTPTGLRNGDKVRFVYNDAIVLDGNGNASSTSASPVGGLQRNVSYSVKLGPTENGLLSVQLLNAQQQPVTFSSWDRNRSFALAPELPVRRSRYSFGRPGGVATISADHELFDATKATTGDPFVPDPARPRETVTPAAGGDGNLFSTRYTPTPGLTYSWAQGQRKTVTTVKTWEQSTFNLIGWDWTFGMEPNIPPDSVFTTTTDAFPLLDSQALLPATPGDWTPDTGYAVGFEERTITPGTPRVDNWTTGGGWLRKKTYHTQTTRIDGRKDVWSHSLKADWPIELGFQAAPGDRSGQVTINSVGAIRLDGDVAAARGIDLRSSEGDIAIARLLLQPEALLRTEASRGSITAHLGAAVSDGRPVDVTAWAAGDLSLNLLANNGSTAPLKARRNPDRSGHAALEAGGTLSLLSGGGLDLGDQGSTPDAPALLKANRLELSLGAGDLGSSAAPLRIDTGADPALGAGLALRLADGSSPATAALREVSGSLALVTPSRFSGDAAIRLSGDLSLQVAGGDLLDGSHLDPSSDSTALAALDARFAITGEAGRQRAGEEFDRQSQGFYRDYWLTYRNARQDPASGLWSADPLQAGPFRFTAEQRAALLSPVEQGGRALDEAQLLAFETELNRVQLATGAGRYDPEFRYQRPEAERQAYLRQRVPSLNAFYRPLEAAVYERLFPQQAAEQNLPVPSGGGSTQAAIRARNLSLEVSGAIGRSGRLERLEIPAGDYGLMPEAEAARLSRSSLSDVVGRSYAVYRYTGATPLDVSGGLPSLADPALFEAFRPRAVAGEGPVLRYLGSRQDDVSLAELDVSATDAEGRPLWQPVTPGAGERIAFDTTAVGVTLNSGDLVRDTRVDLAPGDVVQVDRPARYGYFRYIGPAQRLDLQLSEFGTAGEAPLWAALADGSQNAPLTPQKPPADGLLQPGALVTDPRQLRSVTLQRQTPLGVSLSGSLSASASDLRLRSGDGLQLASLRGDGVMAISAAALSQSADGSGIQQRRGPLQLRSTAGSIGSEAAPLKLQLQDLATLHLSSSADADLSASGDLALGALRAAGRLRLSADGDIRDGGRLASEIADPLANLQAAAIAISAGGRLGSAVSPLLVAGGSGLSASSGTSNGANGLMALRAVGGSAVLLHNLTAGTGEAEVWLSGTGFAAAAGSSAPLIRAGGLVLDGLAGFGTATDPIRTQVRRLAGAVGSGGLFLANQGDLAITTAADRSGSRRHAGLQLQAGGSVSGDGSLSVEGVLEQRSGSLTLQAAGLLRLRQEARLSLLGTTGNLVAGGPLQADAGSTLSNGAGSLRLAGEGIALRGLLNTAGALTLEAGAAALDLAAELTDAQKQELQQAGTDPTSLRSNLILAGSLTSSAAAGLDLVSPGLLALLGVLEATAAGAPLRLRSSGTGSGSGLLQLGSVTSAGDLELRADAGPLQTAITSRSRSGPAGRLSLVSGGLAQLRGSLEGGSGGVDLEAATGLSLAGAVSSAGSVAARAPGLRISASGGIVASGDVRLTASGSLAGQGLRIAGPVIAGGRLRPGVSVGSDPTATTLPLDGETGLLPEANPLRLQDIVLDPLSSAVLELSSAGGAVLGGLSDDSDTGAVKDTVVAGAWLAAPEIRLRSARQPRLLHDLFARDRLAIRSDTSLLLRPLAVLHLGQPVAAGSAAQAKAALQLEAPQITLSRDPIALAIEAENAAPQAFLGGALAAPLRLALTVTSAEGLSVPLSVTIPETNAGSLQSLLDAVNAALGQAAAAAGLNENARPSLGLRGSRLRLQLGRYNPAASSQQLGLALQSAGSTGLEQLGFAATEQDRQGVIPATVLSHALATSLQVGGAATAGVPYQELAWSGGVRATAADPQTSLSWTLTPAAGATTNLTAAVDVPVLTLTPQQAGGAATTLLPNLQPTGRSRELAVEAQGDLELKALIDTAAAPRLQLVTYRSSAGGLNLTIGGSGQAGLLQSRVPIRLQAATDLNLLADNALTGPAVLQLPALAAEAGGRLTLGDNVLLRLQGAAGASPVQGLSLRGAAVTIAGGIESDSPLTTRVEASAGDLELLAGPRSLAGNLPGLTRLQGTQTYSASGGLRQAMALGSVDRNDALSLQAGSGLRSEAAIGSGGRVTLASAGGLLSTAPQLFRTKKGLLVDLLGYRVDAEGRFVDRDGALLAPEAKPILADQISEAVSGGAIEADAVTLDAGSGELLIRNSILPRLNPLLTLSGSRFEAASNAFLNTSDLATGTAVRFYGSQPGAILPLEDGGVYYAVRNAADHLQLAISAEAAARGEVIALSLAPNLVGAEGAIGQLIVAAELGSSRADLRGGRLSVSGSGTVQASTLNLSASSGDVSLSDEAWLRSLNTRLNLAGTADLRLGRSRTDLRRAVLQAETLTLEGGGGLVLDGFLDLSGAAPTSLDFSRDVTVRGEFTARGDLSLTTPAAVAISGPGSLESDGDLTITAERLDVAADARRPGWKKGKRVIGVTPITEVRTQEVGSAMADLSLPFSGDVRLQIDRSTNRLQLVGVDGKALRHGLQPGTPLYYQSAELAAGASGRAGLINSRPDNRDPLQATPYKVRVVDATSFQLERNGAVVALSEAGFAGGDALNGLSLDTRTVVSTTTETRQVGTTEVTVGSQWFTYDLSLLQDAFYAPASGSIREAFLVGVDFNPAGLSWGSAGRPADDLSWFEYTPGQREVVLQALGYLPLYAVDVENVQQVTLLKGVETRQAVANPWFNDPVQLVVAESGPLQGKAILGPEGAIRQAQLTSTAVAPTQALTLQGSTTATLAELNRPVSGLTLEAWVWLDPDAPADGMVLRTGLPTSWQTVVGTERYTLGLRGGRLELVRRNEVIGGESSWRGETPIERGQWVHLAASFSGSAGQLVQPVLMINGVADTLGPGISLALLPAGDRLRAVEVAPTIGVMQGRLQGAIRQVKVWGRGRSAAEIVQDMTLPPSGAEGGLLHWYPLEGSLASGIPGQAAAQIPAGGSAAFAVREGLNGPGSDGRWQELVGSSRFSAEVTYAQTGSALTATSLRQTVENPASTGEGNLQVDVADPDGGAATWTVRYDSNGQRSISLQRSRSVQAGPGFATSAPATSSGSQAQKPYWADNSSQAIREYDAGRADAYGIGRGLAPLLQGWTAVDVASAKASRFSLVLTPGGSLELQDSDGQVLWQAQDRTGKVVTGGARAVMQNDGNFVLYTSAAEGTRPIWASDTQTFSSTEKRRLRLTATGGLEIISSMGVQVKALHTPPAATPARGAGALLLANQDLRIGSEAPAGSRSELRSITPQDWFPASTGLDQGKLSAVVSPTAASEQNLPRYGPGFVTQADQGLATRLDAGSTGSRLSLSLLRREDWPADGRLGIYFQPDGSDSFVELLSQPLRSDSPLPLSAISGSATVAGRPAFVTLTPRPALRTSPLGEAATTEQLLDLQLTLAPETPAGTLVIAPFGSVQGPNGSQRPRIAVVRDGILLARGDQLPRLQAPSSSTDLRLDYLASTASLRNGSLRGSTLRSVGELPATAPLLQAWKSAATFAEALQQSQQLMHTTQNRFSYSGFSQLAELRTQAEVDAAVAALSRAGLQRAFVNGLQAQDSPLWTSLDGRPLSDSWGKEMRDYTTAAGSWPEVNALAIGRDARLVDILSASDQQSAYASLTAEVKQNNQAVWLGGRRDLSATETLRWGNNSPIQGSAYENWRSGEPNNRTRPYFSDSAKNLYAKDPDWGNRFGEGFVEMFTSDGTWNDSYSRREYPIIGAGTYSGIPDRTTDPVAYLRSQPGLARLVVPGLPWENGEPNDGSNDRTPNEENYLELFATGRFNDVALSGETNQPNRGYLSQAWPVWGPERSLQEIWSDYAYQWQSIDLADRDPRQNLSFQATGAATALTETQPNYQQQEVTIRTDVQELNPLRTLRPLFNTAPRTIGVTTQTESVDIRGKAVRFDSLRGRSITIHTNAATQLQGNVASTAGEGRLQVQAGGALHVSGPADTGGSGSGDAEPSTLQASQLLLKAGSGLQLDSGVLLTGSGADPGATVRSIDLDAGSGALSSQATLAPSTSLRLAGASLTLPVGGSRPLQAQSLELAFGDQLSLQAGQPQGQTAPLLLELGDAPAGESQGVRLSSADATGTLQLRQLRTTLPFLLQTPGGLELGPAIRGQRLTLEAGDFNEATPGITVEASVSLSLLQTGDAALELQQTSPPQATVETPPPVLRAPSLRISSSGDLRADVDATDLDLRLAGTVVLSNRASGETRLRLTGSGVQQLGFSGPLTVEDLDTARGRITLSVAQGDLTLDRVNQTPEGELSLTASRGRILSSQTVGAAERRLGRFWASAGTGLNLDLQTLRRINSTSETGDLQITLSGEAGSLLEIEALQANGTGAAAGQVNLQAGATAVRLLDADQIRSRGLQIGSQAALIVDPTRPVTLQAAETIALSAGDLDLDSGRLTLTSADSISLGFRQLAEADALPALPLMRTRYLQLYGRGGVRITDSTWHPEQPSQPFDGISLSASVAPERPLLRSAAPDRSRMALAGDLPAASQPVPERWPYDGVPVSQLLEDEAGVPHVLRSTEATASDGAPQPFSHFSPDAQAHPGFPFVYTALVRDEAGFSLRRFRSSERLLTAANLASAALEGISAADIEPASIQPVLMARPAGRLRPAVTAGTPQAGLIGSPSQPRLALSVQPTDGLNGLALSPDLARVIRQVPAVLDGRVSPSFRAADVWLDSNGNLQRDPDETLTRSLRDGGFRMAVSASGDPIRLVSDGGRDAFSNLPRELRLLSTGEVPRFEVNLTLQKLLAGRELSPGRVSEILSGFQLSAGPIDSGVARSTRQQLAMQIALTIATSLQRSAQTGLEALMDSLLTLSPGVPEPLDWSALSQELITRLQAGAVSPPPPGLGALPSLMQQWMRKLDGVWSDLEELSRSSADREAILQAAEAIGRRLIDRIQTNLPGILDASLSPETALRWTDDWIRAGLMPTVAESPAIASVEAFGGSVPAGGSASFQIQLDDPAPAGGLTVAYYTTGPLVQIGQVTLAEGRNSALVTLQVPADSAAGVLQLVLLNLPGTYQLDAEAAAARVMVIGRGTTVERGPLEGTNGEDLLQPQASRPVVLSGPGRDRILIRPQDDPPLILDFDPNAGDRLQLLRADHPDLVLRDLAIVSGQLLLRGRPIALLQGKEATITFLRDVSAIVELVEAPVAAQPLTAQPDTTSRRQPLRSGNLATVQVGGSNERVVLAPQLPPPPQAGDGLTWLGNGLALAGDVSGPRLLRLQTVAAASLAARQLSLLLYRADAQGRPLAVDGVNPAASAREAVIAQIGAAPDDAGRPLFSGGSTSLLLEPGQQLRALLSRGNAPLEERPAFQVSAEGGGLRLQLGAGSNPELVLRADLTTASEIDLQLESARRIGLGDLLFFHAGDQVDVDVWSSCGFTNTLGFVRVDIDPGQDPGQPRISVAGQPVRNDDAFRRIVRDNLDPGLRVSQGGNAHSSHVWTVTRSGFYSPVMLSQPGDVYALGTAINRDRQIHLKGLGDGAYAFEDLAADQGSDFDYNDGILVVRRRGAAGNPAVVLASGEAGLELAGPVNLLADASAQIVRTAGDAPSRLELAAGRDVVLRQGSHPDRIDLGADDDLIVLGRLAGGASIALGPGRDLVIRGDGTRIATGDLQAPLDSAEAPPDPRTAAEAAAASDAPPADRLQDFNPTDDRLLLLGDATPLLQESREGLVLHVENQPALLFEGLHDRQALEQAIRSEPRSPGDLIPRLQQRGVLNVALPHDRPGLSQRDANGLWSGTAVDLVRAI
ncbi:MAG: LamG-like jellyroll fold domain-containing protein, partial [Synechococcaceae cyanobacterium]|nr:LamG-like jellyroll fold domain-containing protein [Synechococcaceae cyanobacterium]